MRYTRKIHFWNEPEDAGYSNINLEGTGLNFATVEGLPCCYFGDKTVLEKYNMHAFFMLPITIPAGFKPYTFTKEDGVLPAGNKENPYNFQMMYLSDIINANGAKLLTDYTTTPEHDRYEHAIAGHSCISNSSVSKLGNKNTLLFYINGGKDYYIPIFYPNFSLGYFKFTFDNIDKVKIRLKYILEQNSFENNTKQFPIYQDGQTHSEEKLAGIFYEDDISVYDSNAGGKISLKNL